jgi:hypothetical protein
MLLTGAAVAGLRMMKKPSLASAGECVRVVEELPLAPLPEYGKLPALEVVRADWPTAVISGAWHHWHGGPMREGALSLDLGGDALWLGAGADLLRWDPKTSRGTLVDTSCYRCGDVAAIVPTGSGQLWAVGVGADIIRYDQGGLEFLSGGAGTPLYGPDAEAGVDGSGALWLTNGFGSWGRCSGYPSDWRCEDGWEWQESPLTRAMGCTHLLTSLDVTTFWSCASAPGRTEFIPLAPPPCDDWQAVSGSMRCVTWDQDCAGQLVLLSIDPREVERTVPWPGGVNLADVRRVTHSDGQLWLFADALWLFEAGRWQCFEWIYDAPTGLVADPSGDGVWVTVPTLGLLHVSADAARLYHPRDSLYALPVDRDWTPIWKEHPGLQLATMSVTETADGRIWAGTDGGGLWVYDEAEGLWQPTELTQAFVDALQPDDDGGLWVGTRYGGIAHYDGREAWRWWRTYSGLPSDQITALALDGEGRVWAGTADAGLVRFDGVLWERVEIYGVALDGLIRTLVVDQQGRVVFDHSDGVGVCYRGQCTSRLPGEGSYGGPGTIAVDQQGSLWTTSGYSLHVRSPDGEWSYVDEVQFWTSELLPDSRGWIWTGGGRLGVYRLQTGEWSAVSFPESGRDDIYDLFEDSHGRVWVARGHGVSMYDPALGEIEE